MQRENVTVRFPAELWAQAKSLKMDAESLNELVVEALEHEVQRRRALSAHQRIQARRGAIQKRTGPQPDAVGLIRSLRTGDAGSE